jgi:hypothetical protein
LGVPVRDKDLVSITGKIGFRMRGVKTIEYFLAEEIERFGKKIFKSEAFINMNRG